MPRIHFASLFSVDLDYDIAGHWAKHYAECGYDTYTVFLHTLDRGEKRTCGQYSHVRKIFEGRFNVLNAPDEPYTTQMRHDILDAFAKSLDPLDYLCVADSDEFQTPGNWASNFRDLIMSCDVLHGTLVDRWADRLTPALLSLPLDKQYPYMGDVFKILLDKSNDPEKRRWRVPNPNKIIAARAGLPIAHQGSHVLYKKDESLKERRGCIVNHFKWRHTIADRLKTKWYCHDGYVRAVKEFFIEKETCYAV